MNRQQMVNPWQSGMMPAVGAMQTGGSDEAALAFNILNQVLASDSGSMMGAGQSQGRGGFHDRKSRHMGMGNRLEDRRRTQSPQFSRNRSDRGARPWSSRSRSPHGRDGRSNSNRRDSSDRNRKPVMERLGKHSEKNKRYSELKKNQGRDQTSGDKRKRQDDDDRSSKSKERQSSEDKNTEDEDNEAKEEELTKKDQTTEENVEKKLKGKEYDEYVTKCLKCHICEMDSFESIEAFRNHKRSEEHRLMANIYNDRSEAVLQLMRADAKLAANRDREKSGNANKETFSGVCIKCDCTVADALKSHKKTIEHELVDNYLTRECCGNIFARRKEFEDHRITIPHLKRQMESQKENQENRKAVLAFTDDEIAASATLRELKDMHRMELSSATDFPEYDAAVPLGLGYVHKKRRFNCTVCKKSFPSYNTMALAHCRSFNHYMMMSTYLETKLKDVEDDEEDEDEDDITETDEKNSQDGEEAEKEDTPVTDNGSPAAKEEKDKQEEEAKEENVVEADNDNENDGNDGDEEMGENLPPLEDGGILLEDIDKAAEDDGDGALEVAEDSENEAVGDDEGEEEEEEEQQQEEEGEGISDEVDEQEVEDKVNEEVETDEEMKDDEAQEEETKDAESADEETKNEDSADNANDTEEEVEEEEEVVVKPKAARGRRGRGRARGRGAKRNF